MRTFLFGLLATTRLLATPANEGDAHPSPPLNPAPAVANASAELSVRPTMQKYAENVSILWQNLGAFDRNPSREQKNAVIQALTQLKNLSHDVQPTLMQYAIDPVMRHLTLDMPQQFALIESAYTTSNYSHARYLLRQTTQYCVGCHASSTIKHSVTLPFADPVAKLGKLEKAEYFSATRRHEEAMVAYENFLADKHYKRQQPEVWLHAVENLLAITIRIRNDSSVTLEMISSLLDEGGYSKQQSELLKTWRASAKSWAQEKLVAKLPASALLEQAEQLYERGMKQETTGPSRGFIEFMRSMSLLNELAMSDAIDSTKALGYLLSARTSSQLENVFIWMHPEAYYEACVRLQPHSVTARTCVLHLSTYSAEQKEPPLAADKLKQLQDLAR